MKKLDRYIISRLFIITFFLLALLICIFILLDFSEHSDEFADRGATFGQIWNQYYLNYIPEMLRQMTPFAILIACLFLTGQMTERLEIIAIKAAGVSLYRLVVPYLVFGISLAILISYLDAFIIPGSNAKRIQFEKEYLGSGNENLDNGRIYRLESPNRVFTLNHFDNIARLGYGATLIEYEHEQVSAIASAQRIEWVDSLEVWKMHTFQQQTFNELGYQDTLIRETNVRLNIYPQDLDRHSSDIYQLTYTEAFDYIESIRRAGAGGISLPLVHLFGRIAYPLSIIIYTIIGFALSAERRKGGRPYYIILGVGVALIYFVCMKVIEPFGSSGSIDPLVAILIPHSFFMILAILFLMMTKK